MFAQVLPLTLEQGNLFVVLVGDLRLLLDQLLAGRLERLLGLVQSLSNLDCFAA